MRKTGYVNFESPSDPYFQDVDFDPELDHNVVTSLASAQPPEGPTLHYPVIDLDLPCRLVPSSTPGHFHLYIDQAVEEEAYFTLLDALYNAGLVQEAFVFGSQEQGYSTVRLPGVKKK